MTTTAELYIDATSVGCVRYVLVADGKRVWQTRTFPTPEGHEAARARMAAWALRTKVTVVEAGQQEPERQAIIPGRYGRH